MVFSAWGIQTGPFAATWGNFVLEIFKLFHFHTGRPISYYPRVPIMGRGNSSNPKSGWHRGFSVLGVFKLDHLHPIKPLLFWKIFNFFTFLLGGQCLLPQTQGAFTWKATAVQAAHLWCGSKNRDIASSSRIWRFSGVKQPNLINLMLPNLYLWRHFICWSLRGHQIQQEKEGYQQSHDDAYSVKIYHQVSVTFDTKMHPITEL